MKSRVVRTFLIVLGVVCTTLPAFFCNSPNESKNAAEQSAWKNVYDTSVHYVGMQTCRNCHEPIYQTFIQTGMGQSFGHATRQKSAADFSPEHALVYDKNLDYYYKPFFRDDTLYIMEYRLKGRDTTHKFVQRIDYIVGSGQHTNSHIFRTAGGFFYQAPITFYTQKKKWDLAPGFEDGSNLRFTRIIQAECMTCHNGYPDPTDNIQNKFANVKTGIDCERCHGPGSLHVLEKQAGNIVDTARTPDYTIVNPRRLPTELQNSLCQRCHLQGIAVINDGKTFFDFRPGMKLTEVLTVFMPTYEGGADKMIMASHVERMKKSDCYISSGKMSCLTCHNPHVSVKFTPRSQYINACNGCHNSRHKNNCTEREAVRASKNNDCITCHMPHNGSIDIPHVAVTDHYIRKRPMDDSARSKITAFLGLKSYNNDNPDAITTARGYMEFYERFNPNKGLLDSALYYLDKARLTEASEKQNRDYIRAYFLLEDYKKVLQYAAELQPAAIKDGWTAYRIGESYTRTGKLEPAMEWYKQAVAAAPYFLDFANKYGASLLSSGKTVEAERIFLMIVSANPNDAVACNNIGFLYMSQGQQTMAYEYLIRSYAINPDNEQTLINLCVWYHNNGGSVEKVKELLLHLLAKHPGNQQAMSMLRDL